MDTVLVIEDSRAMQRTLQRLFEADSLGVQIASDGLEGLESFKKQTPSIVVLDLKLPKLSGKELCRAFKAHMPSVPIVVLSANAEIEDKVLLLELGADDYVTKPFSPREVVLRCQAILRRQGQREDGADQPASYGDGELVIDEPRRLALLRGREVALTPTEWGILVALAIVPGRVYSRSELINRVRGHEFDGYQRSVDSHVKNLRRKIEADSASPRIIQTVLGGGYRLGLRRDG